MKIGLFGGVGKGLRLQFLRDDPSIGAKGFEVRATNQVGSNLKFIFLGSMQH